MVEKFNGQFRGEYPTAGEVEAALAAVSLSHHRDKPVVLPPGSTGSLAVELQGIPADTLSHEWPRGFESIVHLMIGNA